MSGSAAYESLFASVPLGILAAERDGRLVETNPILRALFDLESVVGSVESIYDEPAFRQCGLIRYFERVLGEGRALVSEGECSTRLGDRLHVRYFLNPLGPGGAAHAGDAVIDRVQCFVIDLTGMSDAAREVRRIYSRFDSIVSNISPVVTFDEDYRILFTNRNFRREFTSEASSAAALEGQSLFDIFPLSPAHADLLRSNVAASSQRAMENCEFRSGGRILGYTVFRLDGFAHPEQNEGQHIGLILKDISRIKKLEEKVARLHSRLLHLQERERQVVASELHDGVGQTILAAKLNFTSYEKDPERFADRFPVGLDLIDRASQELRDLYTRLYPSVLNDLGLEAAIRWYSKVFLEILNIDVELEFAVKSKIPRPVETHLFRIVQELFTNIVKHSGANRVWLHMTTEGLAEESEEFEEADATAARGGGPPERNVYLTVRDDGRGFSPDKVRLNLRGFGLDNIRRRIDDLDGTLRIDTEPGEGTAFEITIPLD